MGESKIERVGPISSDFLSAGERAHGIVVEHPAV